MSLYAGFDVSYTCEHTAIAVIAVCDHTRSLVHTTTVHTSVTKAYLSGHLAMRELPAFTHVWSQFRREQPDMRIDALLVDGNGVWHPRGEGLAVLAGRYADIPTIGVSKSLLKMNENCTLEQIRERGARCNWPVYLQEGNATAAAVLTGDATKKPIYVSVGHNIDLAIALDIVKSMCVYRIPEPVRQADLIGRELLRRLAPVTTQL